MNETFHPKTQTPPGRVLLMGLLALSVLAMSLAAPLIRIGVHSYALPVMVIALWRMGLSTVFTSLFWAASPRRAGSPTEASAGSSKGLILLSGLLLGIHFASWISSLTMTSVAASVVLVNTQPLFTALLAPLFLGEKTSRRQWGGMVVALAGGVVIFLCENHGSSGLMGNLLALVGAVSASGYYMAGRALRRKSFGLWSYVTPVYGISALCLLGLCLYQGAQLIQPWPLPVWLIFLALALGPSLLGHTLLNWALRWLPAPVINLVPLGEPIGSTLLAALIPAIAEIPSQGTLWGGGIVLMGIAVALWGRTEGGGQASPGE